MNEDNISLRSSLIEEEHLPGEIKDPNINNER